ncbi:hypothetical protein [Gemella sp. Musashino-2025]
MNNTLKIAGTFVLGLSILTGCSDKVAQKIDSTNDKNKIIAIADGEKITENNNENTNKLLPSYENKITDTLENYKQKNIPSKASNSNNYNHDFKEAGKILKPMIYSLINLNGSNIENIIRFNVSESAGNGEITTTSMSNILDLINTYNKETYHTEDVLKKLRANPNFIELDKSKKDYTVEGLTKLLKTDSTIIYFKKDNSFTLKTFVGYGGATDSIFAPTESWKIKGDRIIIPYVTVATNKKTGEMTLRLNNKQYEHGNNKTKYYVESFIIF